MRAHEAGAKAVALKFFFDLPSRAVADAKLARAIASMPVYLQFAFGGDDANAEPNLPIWLSNVASAHLKALYKDPPGLLPLPSFRTHAAAIGFVNALPDHDFNHIELLGFTGSQVAASLQLLAIEDALGAQISGRTMKLDLHGKSYEIGNDGRVRCPYLNGGAPNVYSLFAFLHGRVPKDEMRGRVVIIGNTRSNTPRFATSKTTSLPIHEVFFRELRCLDQLK